MSRTNVSSISAKRWAQLPILGTTRVWLDSRIEGTISLAVGTWCTSDERACSLNIMASFRTGEIGVYRDIIDLTPRESGAHG